MSPTRLMPSPSPPSSKPASSPPPPEAVDALRSGEGCSAAAAAATAEEEEELPVAAEAFRVAATAARRALRAAARRRAAAAAAAADGSSDARRPPPPPFSPLSPAPSPVAPPSTRVWRSAKLPEALSAVCLTIAALIRSRPGRKKMMKAAAVPPTRCSTEPRSGTATATAAESETKRAVPSAEPVFEARRLVTERKMSSAAARAG